MSACLSVPPTMFLKYIDECVEDSFDIEVNEESRCIVRVFAVSGENRRVVHRGTLIYISPYSLLLLPDPPALIVTGRIYTSSHFSLDNLYSCMERWM